MFKTRVLAVLALFVGLAHSFCWDIVVGEEKRIDFYYNGKVTHTENFPTVDLITSITYDPVHYRVLFSDVNNPTMSIYSFDLSTRTTHPLFKSTTNQYNVRIVYDPVTQLLFWKHYPGIYSISLNRASSNNAVDANLLVTLDEYSVDIAVDSCGGYIYWITNYKVQRVRFDGSGKETLIDRYVSWRLSLAIDQLTQKMYWIEKNKNEYPSTDYTVSIQSGDLNGQNIRTVYFIGEEYGASSLALSKDFIYWKSYNQGGVVQIARNPQHDVKPILKANTRTNYWDRQLTAAKFTIKEQTSGMTSCEALKSLIPDSSDPNSSDLELLCAHSMKVSEEPRSECTQECNGARCGVSICQNYCLQGNCSFNAEGQPECSCKAGYSGVRCEVNACHKHCMNNGVCSLTMEDEPVCQCTADYKGQRCDISVCKDYCLQGNCIVGTEGQPKCSCKAGYSGERCEVNTCHEYCLHNGVCSLNEEDDPVCECTADYEGLRCDVATTHTGVHANNMTPQVLRDLHSTLKQIIKEELKHTQAQIQKCEESITDIKNRCTNLHCHDETTPKTQTSN